MSKKEFCTLDKKEKLDIEELEHETIEVTWLDENDDEELADLLFNEGNALDIIDSIFRNGMRETFEDFRTYGLPDYSGVWVDTSIFALEDEISKAISQLKENKDELTGTSKQLLKLCLKDSSNIKVTIDDIDITKSVNIQFFLNDILKPEEKGKKEKIELFNILEEQVSNIGNYDATCYNGIDDYLRENNAIDDIYAKLLNIFNKLKAYYDEGLLPINLDKFFIDEWNKSIKEK